MKESRVIVSEKSRAISLINKIRGRNEAYGQFQTTSMDRDSEGCC